MAEGVKVSLSDVKDEIIIQGNDILSVSQSAAAITDKCRVKDKDIRKFLDGVYTSQVGTWSAEGTRGLIADQ
jgi:large subunit ribosomal protein L9e